VRCLLFSSALCLVMVLSAMDNKSHQPSHTKPMLDAEANAAVAQGEYFEVTLTENQEEQQRLHMAYVPAYYRTTSSRQHRFYELENDGCCLSMRRCCLRTYLLFCCCCRPR